MILNGVLSDPTPKPEEYNKGLAKLIILLTVFLAALSTIILPNTSKSISLTTSNVGKVQPNAKLFCSNNKLNSSPQELKACTAAVIKGTSNANLYCLNEFIKQSTCFQECNSIHSQKLVKECKKEKCVVLVDDAKACVEKYIYKAVKDANLNGKRAP